MACPGKFHVWRTEFLVCLAAGSAVAERARDKTSAAAKHETSAKKKKGSVGAAVPSAPAAEASKQQLSGHSQAVASVAWPSSETIVSGGWDNTVQLSPLTALPRMHGHALFAEQSKAAGGVFVNMAADMCKFAMQGEPCVGQLQTLSHVTAGRICLLSFGNDCCVLCGRCGGGMQRCAHAQSATTGQRRCTA